jgi:putative membrane protein
LNSLRLVLVALLAAGLALFAFANWDRVAVTVWPGTVISIQLPVLILLILALVYIPMSLWMTAQKMLLRRKVARLEGESAQLRRELEQARVELLRPPERPEPPAPMAEPVPPQAIPHAPPPPGT